MSLQADAIGLAESYAWLWDEWLAPTAISEHRLRELRSWFTSGPDRPFHIEAFLRKDRAERVFASLENDVVWGRTCGLVAADGSLSIVSESEGAGAPNAALFLHDLATDLRDDGEDDVASLLRFAVTSPLLASWVALIVGRRASIRTCEITRYHKGDYINPHTDTHDDRLLGLNLYLDRYWQPEEGGSLNVRSELGTVVTEPRFLSAAVLPIAARLEHWVAPWRSERTGRYTMSLSFGGAR